MLKLENISKYYHAGSNVVLALNKINLEFRQNEFVVITGESGSGKSTLLNVIGGLDTYEHGKFFVDGKDLTYYTKEELENYRKDYIGFIFQEYNIIDNYTVFQNIELALTVQGLPKKDRKEKVLELIQKVGLMDVMHQKAKKLSGGEQQRTVIARALAKDSKIIVCDEPTGNLDSESGKAIMKLLKDVSKDKLVIVVTHDFESIADYATRKIRLYDGEVLEDNHYQEVEHEEKKLMSSKEFNTAMIDRFRLAFSNVVTVPKKSLFTLLVLVFIITVTFFTYGNGIAEQNRPYSFETPYFDNPDKSRIILSKFDETVFTDEDIDSIKEIEYVRTVITRDSVFDILLFSNTVDPIYGLDQTYYFRVLSDKALNEFDLLDGRLPESIYEVVVSDRTQYRVGDTIGVEDVYLTLIHPEHITNQFRFEVVGVTRHNVRYDDDLHTLYLTDEALEEVGVASVYQYSEIYIEVFGTTTYITEQDVWVTKDIDDTIHEKTSDFLLFNKILIDDSLADFEILTYDMMFYDLCRDFGYKKEIVDDMDAGLCNVDDYIASHSFRISAISTFENEKEYVDIVIDSESLVENGNDQHIYMNEATYRHYFGENKYQISVVVYDVYEGKQVALALKEMGYNVFYPSQIVSFDQGRDIALTNVRIMLVIIVTLLGVFLVGYLVLKNIIMSKQKGYLIYRSIGATKRTTKSIIQLEVLYLFILSAIIVVLGIFILEQYNTRIPPLLRYIKWIDYFIIFTSVLVVLELMIKSFGNKIFNVNLISTLKGIEL